MSEEGMTAEQILKRFVWLKAVEASDPIEKFTTWSIGGVAAISALLVTNIESVGEIVSGGPLKAAIIILVMSLLAGAASKYYGMALTAALTSVREVQQLLNSEAGKNILNAMNIEPRKLVEELSEPWIWPMSAVIRGAGMKGLADPLAPAKRLVSFLCIQMCLSIAHALLALAALLVIGLAV